MLKNAPVEWKKFIGQEFNLLKGDIEQQLAIEVKEIVTGVSGGIDITLPGTVRAPGIPHPLLKTMHEIVQVFHHLGYSTSLALRSNPTSTTSKPSTSPQPPRPRHPGHARHRCPAVPPLARPPLNAHPHQPRPDPVHDREPAAPAPRHPRKVHRNDAADATHSPIFHQVEGLCVDTNITFSDLKGTLDHAMKALFGSDVKTRFFPSFFPLHRALRRRADLLHLLRRQRLPQVQALRLDRAPRCGMVDPAVFASVTEERRKTNPADDAYNPEKITGFAFGMGVERIAMIQHGISDIGHFYSGDMRFLEQFA